MQTASQYHRRFAYRALMRGGLALSVLLGTALSSTVALAGCGDYVVIGNPLRQDSARQLTHSMPARRQQDLAQSHAGRMTHGMSRPAQHVPAGPCQGPGCRQGRAFPPLPVPTVVTTNTELSAMMAPPTAPIFSGGCYRADGPSLHLCAGAIDRVERPPRILIATLSGSRRGLA